MIVYYCPDCFAAMEETELNTYLCPGCEREWDIQELKDEMEDDWEDDPEEVVG